MSHLRTWRPPVSQQASAECLTTAPCDVSVMDARLGVRSPANYLTCGRVPGTQFPYVHVEVSLGLRLLLTGTVMESKAG